MPADRKLGRVLAVYRHISLGLLLTTLAGCSATAVAPAAAPAAEPAPLAVAEPHPTPAVLPALPAAPRNAAEDEALQVQPGQCWVYAQVKPKPVQRTVEVVIKDSVNRISVTPAEVQRGFKQVVTREGTRTYRIEPPTYKQVSERIEVRPEVKRYEVVPAVYQREEQEIVLEEGKTVLDPCGTAGTRYAKSSAVVAFCAREVAPRTKTVATQVLVEPERVREVIEPARYETISRWVVDKPAQAVEVVLPPETGQVAVQEVLRPSEASQVIVPEQVERMQVLGFEGKARIVSRQAVCDADLSEELVRAVQQRLSSGGHAPGRIDGKLGPRTIEALVRFQEANGLAVGALTLESLEALGLR